MSYHWVNVGFRMYRSLGALPANDPISLKRKPCRCKTASTGRHAVHANHEVRLSAPVDKLIAGHSLNRSGDR